jgi:hypothetical protein
VPVRRKIHGGECSFITVWGSGGRNLTHVFVNIQGALQGDDDAAAAAAAIDNSLSQDYQYQYTCQVRLFSISSFLAVETHSNSFLPFTPLLRQYHFSSHFTLPKSNGQPSCCYAVLTGLKLMPSIETSTKVSCSPPRTCSTLPHVFLSQIPITSELLLQQ